MIPHLEGSQPSSPGYGRNSGCDTHTHTAVAKTLFAEGCFLSSQVQQLFPLTTFLLLLKSLKPWKAACWLLYNKHHSTGAVRSTQSIPYPSSKSFLILNCRDQNPTGKGDFCLHLHPDLILPAPTFFFSPRFAHSRLTLASQMHQAQKAADDTDCCGDTQDYSSTRGWKGSLCSVPSVPSYSVLLQSKSVLQNYIVSITKIVLPSADLSGSDP